MSDSDKTASVPSSGEEFVHQSRLMQLFGVRYFESGVREVVASHPFDAYTYKTYFGSHRIEVEQGDSVWYLDDNGRTAKVSNGPCGVDSAIWATVIRGYRVMGDRAVSLSTNSNLPYVNGCSTWQVFPPDRPGDPTLQHLKIPPYSSEQAHHIHSTVRIVYVLEGHGYSKVGMRGNYVMQELKPGMLVVLEKMVPHHFETPQGEWLSVIPLHVFSALPGGIENNHPMFNGTYLMNQGG